MDLHLLAATLSGLVTIVSTVPYIRDMLKGNTRPNIVSWSLWGLIQVIFSAAQFSSGASWSIVLPLTQTAVVLIVLGLGFTGYGYKKYGPIDFSCLALALGAIVLWKTTGNPLIALWMSVCADFLAVIPTLFKAYKDPNSETLITYLASILAGLLAILSTTVVDLPNLLWPVYISIANTVLVSFILLGRRVKKAHK